MVALETPRGAKRGAAVRWAHMTEVNADATKGPTTLSREMLRERLSTLALTETERLVLEARYGVEGSVLDYSEISRLFGMAPVLVRQLEHRVAASLR